MPAQKGDIFTDRQLAPQEKRALMRFLTAAQQHVTAAQGVPSAADTAAFDGRSFSQYLAEQGLPPSLRDSVCYALALATKNVSGDVPSAREGLQRLGSYLGSVGRYAPGSSPFLLPIYGTGELPQALCRLAAVHGATYVLRQPARGVRVDSGRVIGVTLADGTQIQCSTFVCSSGAVPLGQPHGQEQLSRAICITDASLVQGLDSVHVAIPPAAKQPHPVHALQLGPSNSVSPPERQV